VVDADRDVYGEWFVGQAGAFVDVFAKGARAVLDVHRHPGHRHGAEASRIRDRCGEPRCAERTEALLHDGVLDSDHAGVAIGNERHCSSWDSPCGDGHRMGADSILSAVRAIIDT